MALINSRDPFYQHGLTIIPSWINNRMPSKVWDQITYPLRNVNGCTVEIWEWISDFIPHALSVTSLIAGIKVKPC